MSDDASGCPIHGSGDDLDDLRPYGEGVTYNEYLKIPELLDLQHPLSDPSHHDEMFFIIIHQAYELWFRLMIHELEEARGDLVDRKDVFQANHRLNRVNEVLELLVRQIHLLETMRPADFLEFRDNLKPASGFQSLQFRELEFLLGLKNESYLNFFDNDPEEKEQLEQRLDEPDIRSVFYQYLREETSLSIPENIDPDHLEEDEQDRTSLKEGLRAIYENPTTSQELYTLCETLVDIEQSLGLWRDHHVRVVERIIGRKQGTGGSSGVDYLSSTTSKKCFPYLLRVRTDLEK